MLRSFSVAIDNLRPLGFFRAQMKRFLVFCVLVFGGAIAADAGTETPPPVATAPPRQEDNFAAGAKEFQNVLGYFSFFDTTQNNRPAIDYSLDTLRLGIMLNDPWSLGLLSGNFEL